MLGLSLIQEAQKQGLVVVALAKKDSKYISCIPKGVDIIYASLCDYKDVTPDFSDCDCFFHLAWDKTNVKGRDDTFLQAKNIEYSLDSVALAQKMGCKSFVFAGSQAECGTQAAPITPQTPCSPESGYGTAKFAAGRLAGLLCSQYKIKYNHVRILSVYGKYSRKPSIIPSLMEAFSSGCCPKLTKCTQTWDFLYATDAARALLLVAQKGKQNKTYVLGSGESAKLFEYVTKVRDIVNPAVNLEFGSLDFYPHQQMFLRADIKDLQKDTGWQPTTTFENGIKQIKDFNLYMGGG